MLSIAFALLLLQSSQSASIEKAIDRLPTCALARGDEKLDGWRAIELQHTQFMSIPQAMTRISDPKTFCVHGCDGWRDDHLEVKISYGLWDGTSFSTERWSTACVLKRSALRVVVMNESEKNSLVVWPISLPRPKIGQEAVVNMQWSTDAGRLEAFRVLGSIKRDQK
jgi:hypothetical protein